MGTCETLSCIMLLSTIHNNSCRSQVVLCHFSNLLAGTTTGLDMIRQPVWEADPAPMSVCPV